MVTTSIYNQVLHSDGSLTTDLLQSVLDERGEVTFSGDFKKGARPFTIASDQCLRGLGRRRSIIRGDINVIKAGDYTRRVTLENFGLYDGSLLLSSIEYSHFQNLYIRSNQGGVKLTSRLDTQWRRCRDLYFYDLEISALLAVRITKHPDDPASYGCNMNHFFGVRAYNYTTYGLDVDSGEGNSFYSWRGTSSADGTVGIRVNDDATSLIHPNTDTNEVGKPGTTGIWITENGSAALVMNPNGNGTEVRVKDDGPSSTILRKDLTVT